ncbi:MAG: hypothetical protein AB1540_09080 [Bdellovibrionota bacterium]
MFLFASLGRESLPLSRKTFIFNSDFMVSAGTLFAKFKNMVQRIFRLAVVMIVIASFLQTRELYAEPLLGFDELCVRAETHNLFGREAVLDRLSSEFNVHVVEDDPLLFTNDLLFSLYVYFSAYRPEGAPFYLHASQQLVPLRVWKEELPKYTTGTKLVFGKRAAPGAFSTKGAFGLNQDNILDRIELGVSSFEFETGSILFQHLNRAFALNNPLDGSIKVVVRKPEVKQKTSASPDRQCRQHASTGAGDPMQKICSRIAPSKITENPIEVKRTEKDKVSGLQTNHGLDDQFPFPIEATHVKVRADRDQILGSSLNGGRHYFPWLTFSNTSPRKVVEKFFGTQNEIERKTILNRILAPDGHSIPPSSGGNCVSFLEGKFEHCDADTVYDTVYLPAIEIDPTTRNSNLTTLEAVDWANLYAEVMEKKASDSYEIYIKVDSQASPEVLRKAAGYFSNVIPANRALALLNEAKRKGKIKITEFFPEELKDDSNTFDSNDRDLCHSLGMAFVDPEWRRKRQQLGSSAGRMTSFIGFYLTRPDYFKAISNLNELKFGDQIRFGEAHTAVYLADGYLFMKDAPSSQYAYRFAHIDDIVNVQARGLDYLRYTEASPIKAERRTKKRASEHPNWENIGN